MKEMASLQPGMSFYAELPDSYNLIVNVEQPVIKKILADADSALDATVQPMLDEIDAKNSEITKLRADKDADPEKKSETLEKEVADTRSRMDKTVADYAAAQPLVKQVIDLALLGNGLLRGQSLSDFIRRSVNLL